jgi:hypothetical protein
VGTFALVGGAIGASPEGAGIGFGLGAIAGSVGSLFSTSWTLGDAMAMSVMGLAAGGLVGWLVAANKAEEGSPLARPSIVLPFQVRF